MRFKPFSWAKKSKKTFFRREVERTTLSESGTLFGSVKFYSFTYDRCSNIETYCKMIRQISIQWSHKLPYHAVDRRKLEAFFHFFSFFIFIFTVAQNLTGNSYYNHFKIILKDNMKRSILNQFSSYYLPRIELRSKSCFL